MAGNPDQQEDALDDQYQEEGEDEVCMVASITYRKEFDMQADKLKT